ncbi:MAG: DUF4224 domain-containing protein [Steroidobacteraceae bacterium]
MSLWLTEDELVELTGYKRQERQRKALSDMGIPFRSRAADGYPLVLRDQFSPGAGKQKRRELNWAAVQK